MRYLLSSLVLVVLAATPAVAGPILGGQLYTLEPGSQVEVQILRSSSSFHNEIRLYTPDQSSYVVIGTDNDTSVTALDLGHFAGGVELLFGIFTGSEIFFMGPAERNRDDRFHASLDTMVPLPAGFDAVANIRFEDLLGGGDNDFNDAIIQVRQIENPEPASLAVWGLISAGAGLAAWHRRRRRK